MYCKILAFDVGGYRLHLYTAGKSTPTVVLEHSLGGIEGYLLVQEIAKLTRVCIYYSQYQSEHFFSAFSVDYASTYGSS
jgi:hypothetical protein